VAASKQRRDREELIEALQEVVGTQGSQLKQQEAEINDYLAQVRAVQNSLEPFSTVFPTF
jgi:hypothetical protein